MITEYINAAMKRGYAEPIGDGTYFAEIPGVVGVWGNAPTAEGSLTDLRSALESWIAFGLRLNHDFPEVDGMDLSFRRVELAAALPCRTRESVLIPRRR
jgi:hypothetical protein